MSSATSRRWRPSRPTTRSRWTSSWLPRWCMTLRGTTTMSAIAWGSRTRPYCCWESPRPSLPGVGTGGSRPGCSSQLRRGCSCSGPSARSGMGSGVSEALCWPGCCTAPASWGCRPWQPRPSRVSSWRSYRPAGSAGWGLRWRCCSLSLPCRRSTWSCSTSTRSSGFRSTSSRSEPQKSLRVAPR